MKKLFVTGVPVVANDLVGRKEELKEITYLLRNGQSVVLIAPRRFGKTSLALAALQKLRRAGFLTANIDLFTIVGKRRLAENIVDKTLENRKVLKVISRIKTGISDALRNVEIKQIVEDYGFVLKFAEPHRDLDELLDSSFDFPEKFARREDKDSCFFYDEFGDIAKFDGEDIIKLMRGKFQRHSRVRYLFAGSHESLMNELFGERKSAFYKFCKIIYLKEIGFSDFTPYIKKKFGEENMCVTDDAIEVILAKTRGHPYYTQLVCRSVHYLLKGEKSMIESGEISRCYEDAFDSEKAYLEQMWGELRDAPAQLNILLRMACGENKLYSSENKTNVARSLRILSAKGLIRRDAGSYRMTDPFLEEFLRRNG
jgi:AAA+ ATPase superfamily predicted ATPase